MIVDTETAALADQVDAHADYKVLRRLQMRDRYADYDGNTVRLGVILDTETTGLNHEVDVIIELAMLLFEFDADTGRVYTVKEVFSGLEDPGFPIPIGATEVHGISDEMVAGKKFDEAEVLRVLTGVSLVIAHNASFDRPMLEKRFSIFSGMAWACSLREIDWRSDGFGASALEFLAYASGFFYDAHRAEMDCRAVLEVLQNKDKQGLPYLKRLIDRAAVEGIRIWALNAPFDQKDILRDAGYRWSPANPKAWGKLVDKVDARTELKWLLEKIYMNRATKIQFDVLDSACRFTSRTTKTQDYVLKPDPT